MINNEKPVDQAKLAEAYNHLGLAYLDGGKHELANQPLQQALEISKKLHGEEHPSVAIDLNNLAALYHAQGRYEEAEPLYQEALAMDRKLLGEDHPSTKQVQNNYQKMLQDKQQ